MGGRVSVASESYHYTDQAHQAHQAHQGLYGQHGDPGLMAAHPGHMNYSSNYDNGNNYGQFYHDPNMTANSVFEDQGPDQGLLTPLPGTLGQGAAPRAVFDEDQGPEPAPAMFSRQQAAPTQPDQQPGLCLLRFAYHSITLNCFTVSALYTNHLSTDISTDHQITPNCMILIVSFSTS